MAEEIKKELLECSHVPPISSHACITANKLEVIMGRIKNLEYEGFLNVYEYVKSLNLPEDFLKELDYENIRRKQL